MRFTQSIGLMALAICLFIANPFTTGTANGQQTQDLLLAVPQTPAQGGGFRRGQRQRGFGGGQGGQGRRGGDDSQQTALVVGQVAPNFALDSLDGKSVTSLDQLRSEKPVVLFFGSYT